MLVPVMVLGIMGCGGTPETGTESPYNLHGTWLPEDFDYATDIRPYFVITANELTVVLPVNSAVSGERFVQLAFVAEYSGPEYFYTGNPQVLVADRDFSLFLTRIVDGVEWGTLEATLTDDDTITITADIDFDTSLVPYYEYNGLLALGPYTRAVTLTP